MKRKIISVLLAFSVMSVPFVFPVSAIDDHVKDPIAAGDISGGDAFAPVALEAELAVLELEGSHDCSDCPDDHVRDPIAAGDIFGDDEVSFRANCPRCGGTLRSVCSGQRHMNGSDSYWHVDCYVVGHPPKCETIQTRFYTDTACVNYPSSCLYRVSSSTSHIESYFHSKDASCYDNNYCPFPHV